MGQEPVVPRELAHAAPLDAVIRLLAAHYGTTPAGLLEGLVALEYSLVLQDLDVGKTKPIAPRLDHPRFADGRVVTRTLNYARKQVQPFTTRMAAKVANVPHDDAVLILNAHGWPWIEREGVGGYLWLPIPDTPPEEIVVRQPE